MTLNSEGLLPCPFCGESLRLTEGAVRWWKHPVTFPPEMTCPSMSMVPIEKWPERDEAAIAAWNRRAVPPVDGLEVVAWRWRYRNLNERFTDWGYAESEHAAAVMADEDGEIQPLVALSQASSVIAGLKAERDEAQDAENQAKDCFWAIYPEYLSLGGTPVSTEVARTKLAARISSLEEENKRLREALEKVAQEQIQTNFGPWPTKGSEIARQALGDHNG